MNHLQVDNKGNHRTNSLSFYAYRFFRTWLILSFFITYYGTLTAIDYFCIYAAYKSVDNSWHMM